MILNTRALAVLAALSLTAVPMMMGCAANTGDDVAQDEETQDLVSRSASFQTFKGLDGQYYFHLVAGNGENVLRSEGYTRLASAQNGVSSVLANGNDKRNFDLEQAMSGEWYFDVKAANGETVGTSQLYSTKSGAERGARTVRALVRLVKAASTPAPALEQFEIFEGEDGQSYFHLRAGNGEIMLSSEGYTRKASAENGVASVKANGAAASSYQIIEAWDGGWAVRLVASNGEIIARTETYATKSNAERA
ncbi:MAG TPA: DUF1508 domain-containing protein, partial [Labilithrix sp.]